MNANSGPIDNLTRCESLDIQGTHKLSFAEQMQALEGATIEALQLWNEQRMWPGPFRQFACWALQSSNPARSVWLQLIAATQLSRLTATMFRDVTDTRAEWEEVVRASQVMNIWQIHEVVSDNLAIGLARHDSCDANRTRRQLLRQFNSLMIAHLDDTLVSPTSLDSKLAAYAGNISLFEQSLAPEKYRQLAQKFVSEHPGNTLESIEFDIAAPLASNILSCVATTQAVSDSPLGTLIRQSITQRYLAVSRLLSRSELASDELFELGAHSILVVPTLGYYIAVLARAAGFQLKLRSALDNGTIMPALSDAAMIVRLLNDFGTSLLKHTNAERRQFYASLREKANCHSSGNLEMFVNEVLPSRPELNRIAKDLKFGEFNIGLHGLGEATDVLSALDTLEFRTARAASLFKEHWSSLVHLLAALDAMLDDSRAKLLIERFVRFHEQLYISPIDSLAGEYGV